MKSNDGFILLDALCAFMLLSTSLLFFNKLIVINANNTININDQIIATNKLIENMHNNYKTTNGEVTTYQKGDQYCAKYNDEEICIYQ